ncbi:MAG: DUF433 domain-containing protein [Calditrichaeota bacterium]|nr:MAG: DUF433 domain-containing protein [Calditrichota bacterium]
MSKNLLNRIVIDKDICHGKPHVKGTRIMVEQVLNLLSQGATPEEIISEDFPDLNKEDILACIAFANQLVRDEEIRFFDVSPEELV